MAEGEDKKECPKKECEKEECQDFGGFHGFGPRCHGRMGFPPMWPYPPRHHKERKCECGEVIPKRKPGEPKIKECPKCKKALPKKEHGFGLRCHKRMKFMKMMKMMNMMGMWGRGPEFWGPERPPCPPPFGPRGLEVHHYIHFGPPPFWGPPPMGPPPMGRPPFWGPPPMGPPPFLGPKGPCGKGPCEKEPCGKGPCEKGICEKGPCEKGPCEWPCFKPPYEEDYPCEEGWGEEPCERPPFWGMGGHHMGPPPCGPFGFGPHFGFGPPHGFGPHFGFGPWGRPPYEGFGPCGKPPCCDKKCKEKKCEKKEEKDEKESK